MALRYRFEGVDDAGVASGKDASASTLRTTLSYSTESYKGVRILVEAENVAAVGNEDLYRNAGAGSLSNGVTGRPVVADPALTEVNQAYVAFGRSSTIWKIGRQELNLGDQRFVGAVGWRQNHQSFDALSVTRRVVDRLVLTYAFVAEAQRIFGDGKEMTSHLLNGRLDLGDAGRLTAYAYLLDYDRAADSGLSTQTLGLEYAGSHPLAGGAKLLWEIELAEQSDAGDNPVEVDAGYLHGMLGSVVGGGNVTLKAGLEILEGSPEGGRFTTPLATLHKFNGWADKFLNTPGNGLEDLYVSAAGKATPKLGWLVALHRFDAETGGATYGKEIDLQLTYAAPWGQTFGAKAAFYDADDFAADTDKLMLWTAYRF